MKKRFNLKNSIGIKNLLLTVVALILTVLLVAGVTYSWIEQISNVEMEFGTGTQSPMHISTDNLNKPAVARMNGGNPETIDLSHYFYESGNMHLSSCYSDGKTFYFPKNKATGQGVNNVRYRLGTKSDANVNYISVSFKLTNTEQYEQAYWFDKTPTFFESGSQYLDKLIRCSMTVDGATSVFSAEDTPTYKTVSGISHTGNADSHSCQSFKAYQFDANKNNQTDTTNDNYNSTRGANGNVLFTLPANKTSIVTIKVWLEYNNSNRSVSLSKINMKLVSSFTKTRKIYFTDKSLYNTSDNPTNPWILKEDNTNYDLFLSVLEYDSNNDRYLVVETFTKNAVSGGNSTQFYFDVPSYYNGAPMLFLMTKPNTPNGDSSLSGYASANYPYINSSGTTTDKDIYNGNT